MLELEFDSLEVARESGEISVGKGTSFTLDKSREDARVFPFLNSVLCEHIWLKGHFFVFIN